MLKNIYNPTSGAIAQERALEIVSNNLANMNTVGFKGDKVTFTLLEPEPFKNYKSPVPPANFKVNFKHLENLHGNDMDYVGVAEVKRDLSQGPAVQTGNKTDLMIEGNGYFAIHTDEGTRYTRAGNLSLSPEGALTTKAGYPVLGEKGAVFLRSGQFEINRSGEIFQDGKLVDRINLFEFKDPAALERVGQNLMFYGGVPEGVSKAESVSIKQGYIEGSNVNPIKNLTAMITAHRSYEAYQKAVKFFDSVMEKSSNTIGTLRV